MRRPAFLRDLGIAGSLVVLLLGLEVGVIRVGRVGISRVGRVGHLVDCFNSTGLLIVCVTCLFASACTIYYVRV